MSARGERGAHRAAARARLTAIPGVVLYIGLLSGAFSLDLASLAVMCGVFAAVDAGLLVGARATFPPRGDPHPVGVTRTKSNSKSTTRVKPNGFRAPRPSEARALR